MSVILTNSFAGQKEAFVPQDPANVRIYACGPTVYNCAHIGNARPAMIFDVPVRLLRDRFPAVTYTRNFIDAARASPLALETPSARPGKSRSTTTARAKEGPVWVQPCWQGSRSDGAR